MEYIGKPQTAHHKRAARKNKRPAASWRCRNPLAYEVALARAEDRSCLRSSAAGELLAYEIGIRATLKAPCVFVLSPPSALRFSWPPR
jgi:hypothetical protein